MRYLIGIGNYYGQDDSIGLRVAEAVADRGLDRDFRVIDMGGNLLDLVHYIGQDTEQVLIVDAAKMGLEPGSLRFFGPGDVMTRTSVEGVSTHEGDLLKVLELASSLGALIAPITILGIEPSVVGEGPELSDELSARFEGYVDRAVGFFAS